MANNVPFDLGCVTGDLGPVFERYFEPAMRDFADREQARMLRLLELQGPLAFSGELEADTDLLAKIRSKAPVTAEVKYAGVRLLVEVPDGCAVPADGDSVIVSLTILDVLEPPAARELWLEQLQEG